MSTRSSALNFEILDPQFVGAPGNSPIVWIDVTGSYSVSTQGAYAYETIGEDGGALVLRVSSGNDPEAGTLQPYDYSIPENINTPIEVNMIVGSSAPGFAFLDPYFSIDPSSPAGPYSIITSYGVSNALGSGVPEPSTWAMMLLGFLGLGFAGYRKSFIRTPPLCG